MKDVDHAAAVGESSTGGWGLRVEGGGREDIRQVFCVHDITGDRITTSTRTGSSIPWPVARTS